MSLRLSLWPSDMGGCGAYRYFIPALSMRRTWPDRFEFSWNKHEAADDIMSIQRPSKSTLPRFLEADRRRYPHCRYTGDVDDWMYGFDSLVRNGMAKDLTRTLSRLDRISVSTPALAELYGNRLDVPVDVIPNYLHWKMWDRPRPWQGRWERFRIGWMGLVGSHRRDLMILMGVLGPWLERHPDVDFVWAGHVRANESPYYLHEQLGIPEAQRLTLPACDFDRIPRITSQFDVGLVPLREHKGNDAKSALKGMEYAACGIPCIASPAAEYRSWVEPGENGFLARRPKDWITALDAFYEDRCLVHRMGEAARQKAYEHRIDAHVEKWAKFYEEAA